MGAATWRRRLLAVRIVLVVSACGCGALAQSNAGVAPEAWHFGDPAPAGYHVVRKHTWEIVGGSVFAGAYLNSLILALALDCDLDFALDGSGRSSACTSTLRDAAGWLTLPVAGPFLALTERDVRRDGALFWFPLLGSIQLAGAGLFAYGLAVPHWGLKRDAHRYGAGSDVFIVPLLAPRMTGGALVGRF
jgi:hypothetical protein